VMQYPVGTGVIKAVRVWSSLFIII
jgi:hypothetical protein